MFERSTRATDPKNIFRLFVLAISLASLTGCQTGGGKAAGVTQADRLMQAYPELKSGRFAVIADFENPAHMELVQLVSVSPSARCVPDAKQGRKDTGRNGLRFTAGSPKDTVILSNVNATNWYLKRDWHQYDLLMINVESPSDDLALELILSAGMVRDRSTVRSRLPLRKGWNNLKLDLADVGERLPLDDVQEIRLAVIDADKPVTLSIDDIVLVGAQVDVFGDSKNLQGQLYVRTAGKRWHIGAGGKFELVFSNGQIVGWFNLEADPHRLNNLVQGTTLGPSPIVVNPPNPDEPDFAALGQAVTSQPRIVEMNEVRIVIESEWRFVDTMNRDARDRPFHRWRYVIYPSGEIYATVEATRRTANWSSEQLGLAVALASDSSVELRTFEASGAGGNDQSFRSVYASARNRTANALVLFSLVDSNGSSAAPPRIFERFDRARQRAMFVGVTEQPVDGTVARWQCNFFLTSSDSVSDQDASVLADFSGRPSSVQVALGTSMTRNSKMSQGSFDRTTGCYVLKPDEGRVRVTIDGSKAPVFSPAFEIVGTPGRQAWVYVNHLIHKPLAFDAHGHLIFQLRGMIQKQTLIEVLFQNSPGAPSP